MTIQFSNTDATLTNSAVNILSSSFNTALTITRATIENSDSVAHNVTIYRVNQGGTPSTSNIIIAPGNYPGAIPAGETINLPLTGHSLVNGQSLFAMVDAGTSVNISISYTIQT